LARREEVLVERLVGAGEWTVLLPFAVEGTLLLFAAFVLSVLCLLIVISFLPSLVPTLLQGTLAELSATVAMLLWLWLPWALLAECLAIPFLAFAGAWLGMRPLLKSPKLALAAV
jgi:cell division protein FtsX